MSPLVAGQKGDLTEITEMAINQLGCDEEPTALNRSSHQLNDIRRPRPARQPNLGGLITKVEMEPDKIRGSRRDVSVSVIADRLPQSIVERKGKKWAAATHGCSQSGFWLHLTPWWRWWRTETPIPPLLMSRRQDGVRPSPPR